MDSVESSRRAGKISQVPTTGPGRDVIFVGDSRCHHTMDWYRNAQELLAPRPVFFVTDLVESEGQPRLVRASDRVSLLTRIDRWLPARQSNWANRWRNIVKTLMIPLQAWRLRRVARAHAGQGQPKFHAHSMYYMLLCWLAGVDYVGTPLGSEILVRPHRSRLYRHFAIRALRAAGKLTVDSAGMRNSIRELSGREAMVVQNGIDVTTILRDNASTAAQRVHVVSNRGLYPLYRIDRILDGRNCAAPDVPLTLIYPSWEINYRDACFAKLLPIDRNLGRLPTRADLYAVLRKTLLVVSVPMSDSSPRSVYESIFCGCCVAVTYNPWIEDVPACMRARLCVVDLDDPQWFPKAVQTACMTTRVPYTPSEAALDLFDQRRAVRRIAQLCYDIESSSPAA